MIQTASTHSGRLPFSGSQTLRKAFFLFSSSFLRLTRLDMGRGKHQQKRLQKIFKIAATMDSRPYKEVQQAITQRKTPRKTSSKKFFKKNQK